MSKKSDARTALIVERVHREQEWCYARWMERMTYRQIAAAAMLPVEQGGINRQLSPAAARTMVTTYREEQGDVTMTREERRERQSDEIDDRARRARFDLAKAHAALNAPKPAREEFADTDEYLAELGVWKIRLEATAKTIESADRRLAAAMKDERDLHGLAAPTEIKAEVVHRDAILDELAIELATLGEEVPS